MKEQLIGLIVGLFATATILGSGSTDEYSARISKWRTDVEKRLKLEEGWLAVAGLHWLAEGDTTFGLTEAEHLEIPATGVVVGTIRREGERVTLRIVPSHQVHLNGAPVDNRELKLDADKVHVQKITLMAIHRGSRIGLRVWDANSDARRTFSGLKWFPIDSNLCVKAKYVAYEHPKSMSITSVIGDTAPVSNPGYAEFSLHGQSCRLEAQDAGDGLFFNFRDGTSGKNTYAAGRFLDAAKPVDGVVILDFNQATNPPCAFTEFATCPLPPRSNWLSVPIEAGEKTYREHNKH